MREATDAGFFGAFAVLLWFLLWDTIAGYPLRTPNRLGQVLLFGSRTDPGLDYLAIAAYSVLSLLGLILLGLVIVRLVHLAIRQPTLLFALLLMFVMFEVFFLGASYVVLQRTGSESAWWPVLGANLVAVVVMGWWLKRSHRIIDRWLARVPLGDTGDEEEVNTPAAWHTMGQWRTPWWYRLTKVMRPHRADW
jgi:hypothetical protein